MAGLDFKLNIADDLASVRASFEAFGKKAFPRAVQYTLNRVVVDAIHTFRDDEMPDALQRYTPGGRMPT